MAKATRDAKGREEALSREQIVAAAIELLDEETEKGLTFRALATRLATGAGAIYWHVANKSELLVAASDSVVLDAMLRVGSQTAPSKIIRSIAGAIFDTIDRHPWAGEQLSHAPWQTATLQIFERLGRQLQALGVSGSAQFTSASTLVNYIVGVSMQNAAQGRVLDDRDDFLEIESARWKKADAHQYPFLRSVATHLRKHDDRAEFLAGIDLIIAGIEASL